jgi:phosphoglycerate dehydrogenase-like enzyme
MRTEKATPLVVAIGAGRGAFSMVRVAVLDDYQNAALDMADWSPLEGLCEITIFTDHLSEEDALAERLAPFEVLCVMRERTPIGRSLMARLPKLRLICSTGRRNAAIDGDAAAEHGVAILLTGYSSNPTIEMTWALILGLMRNLVTEANSVTAGGWQRTVAGDLHGRTLGVLGLGNIGGAVARIAQAFGMKVVAWSQNLTADKASAAGAELVSKEDLFARADIVTIHLVLSDRTRGVVDAATLARMKPAALLVNCARGPIVDEAALVAALRGGHIAGAAIDVYAEEPLPVEHPFRTLPNVLATPHVGYVSVDTYRTFYGDTVRNIAEWLQAEGVG